MHSSRMRTARSSSRQPGGSASVHAGIHPPGVGPEPPPAGVGLETCKACWNTTPLSAVNRITDTCKNIAFPQLRLWVVTSMHSSRMRTAHRGGVCRWSQGGSALGGVCLWSWGGLPLVRGGVSRHALGQTPPCEQNDRQV